MEGISHTYILPKLLKHNNMVKYSFFEPCPRNVATCLQKATYIFANPDKQPKTTYNFDLNECLSWHL